MFDWRLGVFIGSDAADDGAPVGIIGGISADASYVCCGGIATGAAGIAGGTEAGNEGAAAAEKLDIFGGGLNCSVSSASPSVLTHFFLAESQTI